MTLRRKAYLVYVDLDSAPGTMHTRESAHEIVRTILHQSLGIYHPTVYPHEQDDEQRRVAFLVRIDLDPLPGNISMHTQESAQNTIRVALYRQMAYYNPLVSLAPTELQPRDDEEAIRA